MKLEKRDVDFFLIYWLRNDKELWAELHQLEIKLLAERLVSELSYEELAEQNNTSPEMIQRIFEAILIKIERNISKGIAKHLRVIDLKLRERPDKPFTVFEFFVN